MTKMIKYFCILLIYSLSVFAHHPEHTIQAAEPYPVIWISDYQDNVDGHNIKIHLENFLFAPEKITYKALGNEGYIVITVNDIPIGKHVSYYSNGLKKEEGKYKNGEKNGEWNIYNKKGELIITYLYKNGDEFKRDGVKIK